MNNTVEISHYWTWHLERVKWIGLIIQVLAIFLFLALRWHKERAWRICRWLLVTFFVLLAISRYAIWIIFGIISPSPIDILRVFILQSGFSGLIICILIIFFLSMDAYKNWIRFPHFSPEDWGRTSPTYLQWTGMILAILAIWYPLAPNPSRAWLTIFTYGFPTSFGVTLAPTLLFLAAIFLCASRKPLRLPLIITGLLTAISCLVSEPGTIHGAITAVIGLLIALIGFYSHRYPDGQ
jgi:hypothetical protein